MAYLLSFHYIVLIDFLGRDDFAYLNGLTFVGINRGSLKLRGG